MPTEEIMRRLAQLILRDLTVEGLEHVPASGPALIVSNHPTGIADGIVLTAVISAVRDVTLFNEVLNKASQPYRVTIGAPIPPATLPARSDAAITVMRQHVLTLPAPGATAIRMRNLAGLSQRQSGLAKPSPIE